MNGFNQILDWKHHGFIYGMTTPHFSWSVLIYVALLRSVPHISLHIEASVCPPTLSVITRVERIPDVCGENMDVALPK
jgi:hypothetical protein